MANRKKILTSAVALGTAAALTLGGTFAWQSISQGAVNEASDVVNPGGRLHNDQHWVSDLENDTNIYVENFTEEGKGEDIYARVRLSEYMEVVMNYGTEAEVVDVVAGIKTPKDGVTDEGLTKESATQRNKFDYAYAVHNFDWDFDEIDETKNPTSDFFTWTAGEAVINGGSFSIQQKCNDESEGKQYGYGETLNCYDTNWKNGIAKITVTGGTFKSFDPSLVTEDTTVNDGKYLAPGYESTLEGDWYTVAPAGSET